tara:strand:+ start:354 stop:872 length:519 start_codon:yes stop_codon:yes gene_type:complete
MKKLFLFVMALAFTLTGCEDNESPSTIMTSEITVDDVSFKPSRTGLLTYFMEGTDEVQDVRHLNLIKTNGNIITQGIYINLDLKEGRTNEGGSYIFHIGETATNLFANGIYVEGEMSYGIAGGTVHVTEMTDGYYKLIFEDVEARDVFNPSNNRMINGEFKGKFKVVNPTIE